MCLPTLPPVPVLSNLLASIEVRDCHPHRSCNCPVRAVEHRLSLTRWAQLQRAADREGYGERPPPDPGDTDGREERVALLEARRAAGLGLWNDADRVRMPRTREGTGPGGRRRAGGVGAGGVGAGGVGAAGQESAA